MIPNALFEKKNSENDIKSLSVLIMTRIVTI